MFSYEKMEKEEKKKMKENGNQREQEKNVVNSAEFRWGLWNSLSINRTTDNNDWIKTEKNLKISLFSEFPSVINELYWRNEKGPTWKPIFLMNEPSPPSTTFWFA